MTVVMMMYDTDGTILVGTEEISRAFEFAKSSPFPEPEELLKSVYAD